MTAEPPAVPEQPTLHDRDIVLRPWTGQAGQSGCGQDGEQVARWFGTSETGTVSFLIEHRGEVAGGVEVHRQGDHRGELSWMVLPRHRRLEVGSRAVRLLIGHCFQGLGLLRLEAYLEPDDLASRRTASRAGLRKEGTLRSRGTGPDGIPLDQVLVARLAADPDPFSRDGFLGVLNAGLPTKRVITQGIIRNARGELLMCELVYKREWDLPGGVVDPGESPALALVREVAEELRVDVEPRRLLAANWLPPYRGWDDAVLFVFDLGVHDDAVERAVLQPREITAVHWCGPQDVAAHAAPYVTRMLRRLDAQRPAAHPREGTAYLEDGTDPA